MADVVLLQDQVVDMPVDSNIYLNTEQVCLEIACYCMQTGGEYLVDQSVRLLLDTAALCHSARDNALRATWLHTHTISTLIAIGNKAAAVCERFPHDERMMYCAELCRECVAYCHETTPIPAV